MRSTRPAAEMEPERAISSSTATFPGPILAPETRSSRMLSLSLAGAVSFAFGLRFTMTGTVDASPSFLLGTSVAGRPADDKQVCVSPGLGQVLEPSIRIEHLLTLLR